VAEQEWDVRVMSAIRPGQRERQLVTPAGSPEAQLVRESEGVLPSNGEQPSAVVAGQPAVR
jgi:hypothetical protein